MADAIVVGSGPSGLAAAFRLQQAGKRVRLLESGPKVGGKMRTMERDGFVMDQGAFFFPTTHKVLLEIAEQAGVIDKLEDGGFVLGTERDGKIHELHGDHLVKDFLKTPLISAGAKLNAAKLGPTALKARRANFDGMPDLGDLDDQTITEFSRKTISAEGSEYLLETAMRAMWNADIEKLSRVDLLAIINLFMGAELKAFRGGMGTFSEALAAFCDTEVNAEAVAVEERADDVAVTWRGTDGAERTETAGGCVLATPAQVTLRVHPALDPWRKAYMGRVRNLNCYCMSAALDRPPADIEAVYVQVPPSSHDHVVGIGFDHNKAVGRAPEGKGLVTVATLAEWCEERSEQDDAAIADDLVAGIDQIVPGTSNAIEFTELHRGYQEYMPVGHYRELGRFRTECESRDRRVQLAGDYHSSPSLNSAAAAGQRAARLLLAAPGVYV